jgi:thiopeptide-type bacteriocin biosynthesis protein
LFYSACEKPLKSGGIAISNQAPLLAAVYALQKLALPLTRSSLEKFISDFKRRFDQQKVPLLIALDPDTGIGYGDLVDDLSSSQELNTIRFPDVKEARQTINWTKTNQLLLERWLKNSKHKFYDPIILTRDDLFVLDDNNRMPPLPPTVSLMFKKVSEKFIIDSVGGFTATSLIGRFSVFGNGLVELNRKLARIESASHEEVLFADISQLSDRHVDNINRRVRMYDYEIPLNVYSTLPASHQIPPDDLLVSVNGNELILESVKLNKRVIPRLSSAYNYSKTDLPLFRFLCDLQGQSIRANLTFDLEHLFPGLNFYPAVEFGDVILSQAKWIFAELEIDKLQKKSVDEVVEYLRDCFGIPQRVALGSTDQQLVFNLANEKEVMFFVDCLKGEKKIIIKEFVEPDNSVIGEGSSFVNQFIAFLTHDRQVYKPLRQSPPINSDFQQRNFITGSQWLYIKLFCTPEQACLILMEIIKPIIDNNRLSIKKWFFIRYTENGNHLRLRVNTSIENQAIILSDLAKIMKEKHLEHLVQNYQADIYKREIERYGGDIIEDVETIFCAGSELIMSYLDSKSNVTQLMSPFQFGLLMIQHMTETAYENLNDQLEFVIKIAERFLKEFKVDKQLSVDLDMKYRQLRAEARAVLDEDIILSFDSGAFHDRLIRFNDLWKNLSRRMLSRLRLESLLADLIHMQINRLYSKEQRKMELLLYHCLSKHLQSTKARTAISSESIN